MDYKKKNKLVILGLFITIVFLMVFGILQLMKNQDYENYTSGLLSNSLSTFFHAVVDNQNTLESIIEQEELSRSQLQSLKSRYGRMYKEGHTFIEMAYTLNKLENNEDDKVKRFLQIINVFYLKTFEKEMKGKDVYLLNNKELRNFRTLQRVNQAWFKAIKNNFERVETMKDDIPKQTVTDQFFSKYSEEGVNRGGWIDFINDMHKGVKDINLKLLNEE